VLDTTGASSSAALIAYTIANKNFEVLGTNMTTALATAATTGGLTLTTAGADADQAIVTPHLDTKQTQWTSTVWGSSTSSTFETVIVTGASVAKTILWAGFKLTNTHTVATDDDQCLLPLLQRHRGDRRRLVDPRAQPRRHGHRDDRPHRHQRRPRGLDRLPAADRDQRRPPAPVLDQRHGDPLQRHGQRLPRPHRVDHVQALHRRSGPLGDRAVPPQGYRVFQVPGGSGQGMLSCIAKTGACVVSVNWGIGAK
jgi:hypothetical protein